MGTLYLDRKDIELRREGRHLCLYEAGNRNATIPLNVVERVVVRGQATLSTGVLGLLAEEGVGLLVLSGRQGRTAVILHGYKHGDTARRIAQYRWHHDEEYRLAWAHRLVALKLKAQIRLLRSAMPLRPDCRKALSDGVGRLQRALESLENSPRLERLQGIEGAAAAAYFSGFTQLFPPDLEFTGRNRRPPKDPVNAALSLAYTLLHFEAVNACHAAGLDPYVGFYHEPAYYRESLAADLIEPLRPKVDRWVWRLFAERILRTDSFATEADRCLLKKGGREIFYARYERFVRPLRGLLRRYSLLIARRLTSEAP